MREDRGRGENQGDHEYHDRDLRPHSWRVHRLRSASNLDRHGALVNRRTPGIGAGLANRKARVNRRACWKRYLMLIIRRRCCRTIRNDALEICASAS